MEVATASPKGGEPPVDPLSLAEDVSTEGTRRFAADPVARAVFCNTQPIEAVGADDQDALFFVGGHGGMWDFADNRAIGALTSATVLAGKPVAAVCHGSAALCSAYGATGRLLVEGRAVTGLSNSEEAILGRENAVPFSLEERLRSHGASYRRGADFSPYVVADGLLITGQNMRSAEAAAARLLTVLTP
jgi:putative intracellular protease/amidase